MKEYQGKFFPSGMPVDELKPGEVIADCNDCPHTQDQHISGERYCFRCNCPIFVSKGKK